MWISRREYNELLETIRSSRTNVENTQQTMKDTNIQVNKLYDLISQQRSVYEDRINDKNEVIKSQEARLVVLELERRELTDRLWTREVSRETERNRAPAAITEDTQLTWAQSMQRQIDEAALESELKDK